MADTADLNLVLAAIKPGDPLGPRARRHLARHDRLTMPFSVGIELLVISHRLPWKRTEMLGAAEAAFDVEGAKVLYSAAELLDAGEVSTAFDAVHLADALHRGGRLRTADRVLVRPGFPAAPF